MALRRRRKWLHKYTIIYLCRISYGTRDQCKLDLSLSKTFTSSLGDVEGELPELCIWGDKRDKPADVN